MIVQSKIKSKFSDELLEFIAAVCDTRLIESSQQKMAIVHGLLKDYGIVFEPQGEGTNRVAVFIESYVYKIALDAAGYMDNWMEYTLSKELQPYATQVYETNGYILVAECVRTIQYDEWVSRKHDMKKILDIIGGEYLLHDVGTVKKNFTNWGVRDNNELVILDYAYLHPATENLFSCDVCGSGVLNYDETFSYLVCSNHDGCGTRFNYNDKKHLSAEVDKQLIKDTKEMSLKFKDNKSLNVETLDNGKIVDSNTIIISNKAEYRQYIEEVNNMMNQAGVDNILDMINEVKKGVPIEQIKESDEIDEQNAPKTIFDCMQSDEGYEVNDEGVPYYVNDDADDQKECSDDEDEDETSGSIDDLINQLNKKQAEIEDKEEAVARRLISQIVAPRTDKKYNE